MLNFPNVRSLADDIPLMVLHFCLQLLFEAQWALQSFLKAISSDPSDFFAFSINRPSDTEYGFIPVVDFRHNKITFYEYNNGSLGHKLVELSIIKYLNNGGIIHQMLDWAMNEHNEVREMLDVTL